MNPTTKRALMNHVQQRRREKREPRRYDPEDRYDGWDEPVNRRDSRGRYMRSEYPDVTPDTMPYYPPIYRGDRRETRPERRESRPMNRIGFELNGEMERLPHDYKSDATYHPVDEMNYRPSNMHSVHSEKYPKLTREEAMRWADSLENEDGTTGPHWPMSQIKTVMADRKLSGDPIEWFLAMNLTYSDFCKMFQKYNISNLDAYVDFARAFWLKDRDFPDKLSKYRMAQEM